MEEIVYQKMSRIASDNWWFASRRDLVRILLKRHLAGRKNCFILEAGCGPGNILTSLDDLGTIFGIDINEAAINMCKQKNAAYLSRATIMKIPFKDGSFDAVICSDVLYHVMVDDEAALKEMSRVCKKGGLLLIFEPAFEWLYSPHDIAEHARQRYSKKEICSKVKKSGLIIIKSSYHVFLLFPLILAVRLIKMIFLSGQSSDDLCTFPNLINKILLFIMAIENRILPFINFPWGSTIFCLVVKT